MSNTLKSDPINLVWAVGILLWVIVVGKHLLLSVGCATPTPAGAPALLFHDDGTLILPDAMPLCVDTDRMPTYHRQLISRAMTSWNDWLAGVVFLDAGMCDPTYPAIVAYQANFPPGTYIATMDTQTTIGETRWERYLRVDLDKLARFAQPQQVTIYRHELGHALGLAHDTKLPCQNVMSPELLCDNYPWAGTDDYPKAPNTIQVETLRALLGVL